MESLKKNLLPVTFFSLVVALILFRRNGFPMTTVERAGDARALAFLNLEKTTRGKKGKK